MQPLAGRAICSDCIGNLLALRNALTELLCLPPASLHIGDAIGRPNGRPEAQSLGAQPAWPTDTQTGRQTDE